MIVAEAAEPSVNQCYAHLFGLVRSEQPSTIALLLIVIPEHFQHLFFLILQNVFYIEALGHQWYRSGILSKHYISPATGIVTLSSQCLLLQKAPHDSKTWGDVYMHYTTSICWFSNSQTVLNEEIPISFLVEQTSNTHRKRAVIWKDEVLAILLV